MNGEQKPRWYFAHAQDDLNLSILRTIEDTFSLDTAHLLNITVFVQVVRKEKLK